MCTCWLTTRRLATLVSNKIPNMYATHAPVCLLGALFAFISWEQPCLQSQARFSKWLAELSFLNTGRANIEASKAVSKETQETFGYQHQYQSFSLLMLQLLGKGKSVFHSWSVVILWATFRGQKTPESRQTYFLTTLAVVDLTLFFCRSLPIQRCSESWDVEGLVKLRPFEFKTIGFGWIVLLCNKSLSQY